MEATAVPNACVKSYVHGGVGEPAILASAPTVSCLTWVNGARAISSSWARSWAASLLNPAPGTHAGIRFAVPTSKIEYQS
jgi:hypothetical protein